MEPERFSYRNIDGLINWESLLKGKNTWPFEPIPRLGTCDLTTKLSGVVSLTGPRREKTCLRIVANNTGADQPAHPRSLISTFVIRFLESIISRLATSEISNF